MRIVRFLLPGIVLAGVAWGEDLPAAERAYIASRIYALVQQNFAHWEAVPDLDWNTAYRAYLDQALSSADRRSFDFATMELVAKLQNSHTSFYDDWLYRQDGAPLGFRLVYLSGKWVVRRSEVGGLAAGDVVASIDGTPVEEYYRERSKYIWGSNEQSKRSRFSALSLWFPVRFQLTLDGGRVIEVDRASLAPSRSQTQEEPASEGRWLAPEKIAYIRIPSFSHSKYEASALDLVGKHKAAASLIIDLRGNGGGSTPGRLIQALMDRRYRSWREATPMQLPAFHAQGFPASTFSWQAEITDPSRTAYAGRLFILIDRQCASACEDFAMPFKDNGRATLVGEITAASSGQPAFLDLGNGMSIRVGAKREFFPDGSQFEGVGIAPDVPVAWTAEDLRNGNDPALDKARRLASQ